MLTDEEFQTILPRAAEIELEDPGGGGVSGTLAAARQQAELNAESRRAGVCHGKLGGRSFGVNREQARELRRRGARWIGAAFYDPA